MDKSKKVYRALQKHLDRQPVGFPRTRDGSDLRILSHIFSPEEAELATCLNYRYRSEEEIQAVYSERFSGIDDIPAALQQMLEKGGIEGIEKEGRRYYCTAPLIVGMYEMQLYRLNPEFIHDFRSYTRSPAFGLSYLGTGLPQMRTIPIEKSIRPQYSVADYDTVEQLLRSNDGPFVIVDCICRKKADMEGRHCRVTERTETCLAMGNVARSVLLTGQGREIDLTEARDILKTNQKQGLILQPSNTQKAEFICSCCGCCCGILNIHKKIPRPLDYWSTPFTAVLDPEKCNACGACIRRCQVDAIQLSEGKDSVLIDAQRCLGCGHCVAVCSKSALELSDSGRAATPPEDRVALHEAIADRKGGLLKKLKVAGKYLFDSLQEPSAH